MKRTLIYSLFISLLFTACSNENKVTIFEIGDSRDAVINTLESDFTICGENWSKDEIINRENFDLKDGRKWITLYECVYKGQEYSKIRVYFSHNKVCRIELEIEKDKMKDLHRRLKSKYGESQRANLPNEFPGLPSSCEICTVYLGDIDGVIVTENNAKIFQTLPDGSSTSYMSDIYEVIVVSGEQRYELKSML